MYICYILYALHITAAGIFDCMYTVIDESYTYLTVFNNDSTVDEKTTYRFLCYASILVFINVFMYRTQNITSIKIHDTIYTTLSEQFQNPV